MSFQVDGCNVNFALLGHLWPNMPVFVQQAAGRRLQPDFSPAGEQIEGGSLAHA
jgi:hypothetical protein